MLGGLRAEPDVHRVDDDAADVVDQQVERPGRAGEDQLRGLHGVQGDVEGTGEVVAGAERHQGHAGAGQLTARPELGHREVQAAVTPGDDQRPPVQPVQRAVEVGRLAAHRQLGAEDLDGRGHCLVIGAAGLRAGDQQVAEGRRAHVG